MLLSAGIFSNLKPFKYKNHSFRGNVVLEVRYLFNSPRQTVIYSRNVEGATQKKKQKECLGLQRKVTLAIRSFIHSFKPRQSYCISAQLPLRYTNISVLRGWNGVEKVAKFANDIASDIWLFHSKAASQNLGKWYDFVGKMIFFAVKLKAITNSPQP